MPNTLPVPRKRRTREHIIADLSVNHLERFILEAGQTAERQRADYGYDLAMNLFDGSGYAEPGHADFQLKATDSPIRDQSGENFVYRLKTEDYNLWNIEPLPVFFVLYVASERRAYWLHIQTYFAEEIRRPRPGAQTVTVYIPIVNEVGSEFISYVRRSVASCIRDARVPFHE